MMPLHLYACGVSHIAIHTSTWTTLPNVICIFIIYMKLEEHIAPSQG